MRDIILDNAREFFRRNHDSIIRPGRDYIPVAGKVLSEDDLVSLIDSSLDMWLTSGRFSHDFETSFAKFMDQRFCLLVNSGSSANLLAISSLTSPLLGDRQLKPGDEVITVAAGFPTTVNPIIQNGCIPVFIDVDSHTHQIDVAQLPEALSAKTKAVVVAHTLGNPFRADIVKEFCQSNNLWLIEDCCDAVGARLNSQLVGKFGDIATTSFYPAHHMTMGEGGAVLTSNVLLKKICQSMRDWGRDCWCPTGKDNTCGRRFDWRYDNMPEGYDHKYIYSHIGFNLKVTDMQAALGLSQLKKLPEFIKIRQANFSYLKEKLQCTNSFLSFAEDTLGSEPSWFGFPIVVKPDSPRTRNEISRFLEDSLVGTRLLFGGNLLRQPLYRQSVTKKIGSLANTDNLMNNLFWVGIYPGLCEEHLNYIAAKIKCFLEVT